MEETIQLGFECVRSIEDHALLIMEWRNDPLTRRMSYHSEPKFWDSFFQEFQGYFSLPDLPPLFILFRGQRAAFVRFTLINHPEGLLHRRCCEVSINVAPEFRNKGIATQALRQLKQWVYQQGWDDLYAEVKKENTISQQAFIKAGYIELEESIKRLEGGNECSISRFLAPLSPSSLQPESVFIIAEAGSNWRIGSAKQDMKMARALIEAAAEAGANAVKFQTFQPSSVYAPNAGQADYLAREGIQKDILELFTDLAMPHEMIPELAAHCRLLNIEFMSSTFSFEDFQAVNPYIRRQKIASYEITHLHLIELAAKAQKPLFLSTGAATEREIAWAVETYRELGGVELTLMQCTARYPAEGDAMNLRVIPWLKNRFKVDVGLSDHSLHPTLAPVAAVALGATAIEKHLTIDRSLPGPDHAFAIEPRELKEMVRAIRETEKMLGSGVKSIHPVEEELRAFAQRGIQAIQNIAPGDLLKEGENIAILRPGRHPKGIHPKFLKAIEGRRALRAISIGAGIQQGDWSETN